MTSINDADPRAPEWRRQLAQIRAERPEYADIAQYFYELLPFDPSPFGHLYATLQAGGVAFVGEDK